MVAQPSRNTQTCVEENCAKFSDRASSVTSTARSERRQSAGDGCDSSERITSYLLFQISNVSNVTRHIDSHSVRRVELCADKGAFACKHKAKRSLHYESASVAHFLASLQRSAATAGAGMQQVTDSRKAAARYRVEYLRQSNAPTSASATCDNVRCTA
ncbi:unnamed protein product [Colias eurytheme]|nr:unnamed protein product [Colias eurytheme]